jgi:hypothetical protein
MCSPNNIPNQRTLMGRWKHLSFVSFITTHLEQVCVSMRDGRCPLQASLEGCSAQLLVTFFWLQAGKLHCFDPSTNFV